MKTRHQIYTGCFMNSLEEKKLLLIVKSQPPSLRTGEHFMHVNIIFLPKQKAKIETFSCSDLVVINKTCLLCYLDTS